MKKEYVKLIDAKRSYNCVIALSRFKKTNEQIVDAILELDETAITSEQLTQLLKVLPTQEEIEICKSFQGK